MVRKLVTVEWIFDVFNVTFYCYFFITYCIKLMCNLFIYFMAAYEQQLIKIKIIDMAVYYYYYNYHCEHILECVIYSKFYVHNV